MERERVRAAILCIFVEETQSLSVEGGASFAGARELFRRLSITTGKFAFT